ncbi:hypothetical protein D3C83_98270 [compost metagenome]
MRRNEVEEKFLSLAAPIIGDEKARLIVQEIESLDARDSLNRLLELLKPSD